MASESRGLSKILSRKAVSAPYDKERAITASATRIKLSDAKEAQVLQQTTNQPWQQEAWRNYKAVGEVKYAFGLTGAILSRVRLYVGVITDPASAPTQLTDAIDVDRSSVEDVEGVDPTEAAVNGISADLAVAARDTYNEIFGKASISNLLRSYAINVSVPGECLLTFEDARLRVRSTSEMRIKNGGGAELIDYPGATPRAVDVNRTTIGRVWRENPQYHKLADSSMEGVNGLCDELQILQQSIRSTGRSKMNAGILFVPDEVTVAARSVTDDSEVESEEENVFEEELGFALAEPTRDEKAGNSVIPLLLRGPAGMADSIKHISLSRLIDEYTVERADRVLERILGGIDVPKDMVTGLANVKYANGIQINDSYYKTHIEPLALMFSDAVTDIMLRPLLKAKSAADKERGGEGFDEGEIDRLVIWYDPSDISVRPDRVEDAKMLYDAGELSGDALRRVSGFPDTDAPTENELIRKLALAATLPPEIADMLVRALLPELLKTADSSLPGPLQDQLDGKPAEQPLGAPDPQDVPEEPAPEAEPADPFASQEP